MRFPTPCDPTTAAGPGPVGPGPVPGSSAGQAPHPAPPPDAYRQRIAAAHLTIPELFEAAVADAPDKPWLFFEDDSYTYEQARERIAAAAAGLAERGVGRGDVVLATARNDPRYVFLWLAAAYTGAVYVAVDPRQTAAELEGMVGQVEPKLIVTDDELPNLFERSGDLDGPGPAEPDDAAVLIPTSGTTGRSKLVTQTHRAYAMAGEGFPWWLGLTAEDRLMTSLPPISTTPPRIRCTRSGFPATRR